jgi:hypothetical protein
MANGVEFRMGVGIALVVYAIVVVLYGHGIGRQGRRITLTQNLLGFTAATRTFFVHR